MDRLGILFNAIPLLRFWPFPFLVMVGVLLVAEGLGEHFNRGYVYFGMGFSILVELLNMRYKKFKGD